jgi:bifunctional non-homologous end joining protein LigD
MSLAEYNSKRDFSKTAEPADGEPTDKDHLIFVIQKHAASHLHYDFRLEMDGVLKSWAIPKGPSTDPASKRLAMMVEDHPYSYNNFEGTIPAGEYGGGSVIIWDRGYYEPIEEIKGKSAQQEHLLMQLQQGSLKIKFHGNKLNGEFAMVKTKGMGENGWLLIKHRDEFASSSDITLLSRSVLSGKDLDEIADPGLMHFDSSAVIKQAEIPTNQAQASAEIKPMLATLIDNPFDSEEWQFEVKWDGYRAVTYLDSGQVEIMSRNSKSFDIKFKPIYDLLKKWDINAVFDGEIVVLNADGVSDFSALQNWHSDADGKLVYYIFDVLSLNGKDLKLMPLSERRKILESIQLPSDEERLRLGTIYSVTGIEAFKQAERAGQEGIVAKKRNSIYIPGKRSHDWLKIKVHKRQEVVIAGYTKKEGSPKLFSALLLGVYQEGRLRYIGKVGTGFSEKLEKEIMEEMIPLVQDANPFDSTAFGNPSQRLHADIAKERATWLLPELVCEVAYAELTKDIFFRHPSFKGMRIDKKATSVILEHEITKDELVLMPAELTETPPTLPDLSTLLLGTDTVNINGHELTFSHPDKLYWPVEKISKRDMLNYYHQVAECIVPFLIQRPVSRKRGGKGINGANMYKKDVSGKSPEWITTFPYATAEGIHHHYAVGENEDTLLWMAGQGCIEMNPWFSRIEQPEFPDYAVIDLDPDEHNSFSDVVRVAIEVGNILQSLSVKGYCKTSGSSGIHIYIPLQARYSYVQSQSLVKAIVDIVNSRLPELTSLKRTVSAREGKLYLDFLQNKPAATIACPYSLRPKPGAPVSTPLHWEELKPRLSMYDFHIGNTIDRLKSEGDIFSGVLGEGIDLDLALKVAQEMLKEEE